MKSLVISFCEESGAKIEINICSELWHNVLWRLGFSFCLECGRNLYL